MDYCPFRIRKRCLIPEALKKHKKESWREEGGRWSHKALWNKAVGNEEEMGGESETPFCLMLQRMRKLDCWQRCQITWRLKRKWERGLVVFIIKWKSGNHLQTINKVHMPIMVLMLWKNNVVLKGHFHSKTKNIYFHTNMWCESRFGDIAMSVFIPFKDVN